MMRARLVAMLLVVAGCASAPPRPASLVTLDRTLEGPVARESARDAPEAFAAVVTAAQRARGLEGARADEAVEEVLLALEHAHAVARERRARRRTEEAAQRRQAAEDEARRVESQTEALEADTRQREEARASAERARAAMTSPPTGAPSPARAAAARDLRTQAGLLLAAAQLLGATEAQRQPAQAALEAAERAGGGTDVNAAARTAGVAYTAAEAALRSVRQGATASASPVDAVRATEALSATEGVSPHRDARGVVAVLRGLFAGPVLAPTARTRVQTLARVLQAHGDAPVRLEVFVGGPARAAAEALALRQATALQRALETAGVPAGRLHAAGLHRPADGARADDRAEVVLVLPNEP